MTIEHSNRFDLDFDDAPSTSAPAPAPIGPTRPLLEIDGVDAPTPVAPTPGATLAAMRKAGLDFPIELVQPIMPFDSPNVGDFRMCTRMDTGFIFGTVTPTYGFVQPAELAATFDAAIPAGADVKVSGDDSGTRMWIKVNMDMGGLVSPEIQAEANAKKWIHTDPRDANGDTPVSFNLQAYHAQGGKGALSFSIGVHVKICANGLIVPLNDSQGKRITLRHTKHFEHRVNRLREAFKQAQEGVAGVQNTFERMAGESIQAEAFDAFAEHMFPGSQAKRDDLHRIYHNAAGAAPGTAWGMLQAATYYGTHEYQVRVGGRSAKKYRSDMPDDQVQTQARAQSMAYGPAGAFTTRAYQYVSQLVTN